MHFDRYFYPFLQIIDASQYPLRLNQVTLTGIDESFIKSIYDEMLSEGYCEIGNEIISITEKGKQFLIDNNPNPENKELHMRILEYLNNNFVYGKKLEFVTPILHETATPEQRLEMVLVIRQLKQDGYIDFDGRENVLCDKQAGVLTRTTQTGLKATITDKGREYLNPKPPISLHPVRNTTNNIHNSAGIIIGDGNEVYQPDLSQDNSLNSPKTTINNPEKSQSRSPIEKAYWVIYILIGLTVLYTFLHTKHLFGF